MPKGGERRSQNHSSASTKPSSLWLVALHPLKGSCDSLASLARSSGPLLDENPPSSPLPISLNTLQRQWLGKPRPPTRVFEEVQRKIETLGTPRRAIRKVSSGLSKLFILTTGIYDRKLLSTSNGMLKSVREHHQNGGANVVVMGALVSQHMTRILSEIAAISEIFHENLRSCGYVCIEGIIMPSTIILNKRIRAPVVCVGSGRLPRSRIFIALGVLSLLEIVREDAIQTQRPPYEEQFLLIDQSIILEESKFSTFAEGKQTHVKTVLASIRSLQELFATIELFMKKTEMSCVQNSLCHSWLVDRSIVASG
ncbi:hypothetical protein HPP92_028952 [Vanilla planifolia]|uniref:Uncharacterized protein n=1 Tax=Vanilla planifolia TaxID=51239 RepID=A0A835P5Q5_VANPL|nr:hypothetical protein HPP92_028942 [Vanilla planifolia]KAG0446210.1 hypothetical protein HPP92_028952 [Vanilla planifolia]